MASNDKSPQKSEEQYEELRDKGVSKEKAGRNASEDSIGGSLEYRNRSHSELMAQAKKMGLSGYSEMTRDELINALRRI